jgi:hypothetical protein
MCDTLHLPARLVLRLRVTSPQPPSFWQRIAAAQERDECFPGLLPNDSSTFIKTQRPVFRFAYGQWMLAVPERARRGLEPSVPSLADVTS